MSYPHQQQPQGYPQQPPPNFQHPQQGYPQHPQTGYQQPPMPYQQQPMGGQPPIVRSRQQTGHSLIKHLLLGWLLAYIPTFYYMISPNHYFHA